MYGSYDVLNVGTAVEYRLRLVEIYASDEIRLDAYQKAYLVLVLPLQSRSCVQKVKIDPFQIFWGKVRLGISTCIDHWQSRLPPPETDPQVDIEGHVPTARMYRIPTR